MTDDREWNHAVVVAEKSGRPAKPPHPSGSHLTHRWREMDSNPLPLARNPAFLRLLQPRLQSICTPIMHQFAPLWQRNVRPCRARGAGRYRREVKSYSDPLYYGNAAFSAVSRTRGIRY
jgi:hypothetical protein